MQITNVATSSGGTVQSAINQWLVVSPGAVSPPQFYQQVLYLHFDTGGIADQVALESDATVLQGAFQPYDYNPLSSNSLQASTSPPAVKVTLDVPRQVISVTLPSAKAPDSHSSSHYSIELHRVDGDNVADKPTASTGNGANFSTDFTDNHFAIQLNQDGQIEQLNTGDIFDLRVRGYPTGPRIGIADPNQLSSAVFFWRGSGEIGKTTPAGQGVVDVGKDLADALERYLNTALANDWKRYQDGLAQQPPVPKPPPQGYDVALVIASDAPCRFDITRFRVVYHRVLQSFPSRNDKQALRFVGNQASTQTALVNLPGNATVTNATLKTVESFRRERPASISGNENLLLNAILPEKNGAYLDSKRWVAQGFTPTQAISATGIALGIMTVTARTELQVELQEDWQGKPSGKKLISGTIPLGSAGQRSWVRLLFPQSIILSSQPYWILVKAARGSAVWLVNTGTTSARVLEKADQTRNVVTSLVGVRTELSVLKGLEALYQLFSASDTQHVVARLARAIVLSIGNTSVAPLSNNGGTPGSSTKYDLAAPFNTYLRNLASTSNVSIPLTFTAAVPGIMIVYPPYIEYDV